MTDTGKPDPSSLILGGWNIERPWTYLVLAVSLPVVIRIIMTVLRSLAKPPSLQYREAFWRYFVGFGKATRDKNLDADYLLPYFLGVFETIAYPILMKTGNWTFIGAWLAFKSVAQWKTWSENRVSFNRFLIGNVLVFIAAFLLTRLVNLS